MDIFGPLVLLAYLFLPFLLLRLHTFAIPWLPFLYPTLRSLDRHDVSRQHAAFSLSCSNWLLEALRWRDSDESRPFALVRPHFFNARLVLVFRDWK